MTDFQAQLTAALADSYRIERELGAGGMATVYLVFAVQRDVIGPPRLTKDGRAAYFSRRVTEADIWLMTFAGKP